MIRRHVILTGPRGAGKSELIEAVIPRLRVPVYGFITDCLPANADGFHPIYIHPAGRKQRQYGEGNRIGTCDTKIHNIRSEVFDTLGVNLVRSAGPDGLLVMDELGFMEEKSPPFMNAVREALNGEIPILAACKDRKDVAFLSEIRAHPAVRLYELDEGNRDSSLKGILEWLASLEMLG